MAEEVNLMDDEGPVSREDWISGSKFVGSLNFEDLYANAGNMPRISYVVQPYLSKVYLWKPQEDITPYELALSMPIFSMVSDAVRMIKALPASAQRHWEEAK